MPDLAPPEDDFKAKLDAGLWWKLIRRAFEKKRMIYPLIFVAVLIAACDIGFTLVTRWVIDGVVQDGGDASFTAYIGVYLGIVVCLSAGVWWFIHLAGGLAHHLAFDIRTEGFARLQELEFNFYDTRPVGWLIARLTSDCDRLARVIAWGILDIFWGLSFIALIAVSLLVMNWRLGLVVLAVVPPLALISRYFQLKLLFSSRDIRKYNSQITATFNESIAGVRTTKSLVREADNLAEFEDTSAKMFEASVRNARQSAVYYPVVFTLGSLAAGLALWRGGIYVNADTMTLGTLVAFSSFATQLFHPIQQLAQRLTDIQSAQAAGERVMGLLETEPEIRDSEAVLATYADPTAHAALAAERISDLEFRDVDFSYATGGKILEKFNLKVRPGETIALVGPSGGGKSTIVSLACRFYEPTSGAVLVNGVDYRERPLQWLQSQLGSVLQTPHLFKGSVRDNIRYGRIDATDAEVETVARLVNAHDFICALEDGYDTPVGEGGSRLSTGQRQLVSFARALLAEPSIFIMDEATSSVDTETEQLIQAGLRKVLAGRISFVIAHRLSTIRRADRILVIEGGKIAESGTHETLLRQRGHYYTLYTNQFSEERVAETLGR
ncbi:MAG: ABC transporter ATP-binding protein [Synoicihabitans sp.]